MSLKSLAQEDMNKIMTLALAWLKIAYLEGSTPGHARKVGKIKIPPAWKF